MALENKLHITDSAELGLVVDWVRVDKVSDRETFMKGIDHSYYYEGCTTYRTADLL